MPSTMHEDTAAEPAAESSLRELVDEWLARQERLDATRAKLAAIEAAAAELHPSRPAETLLRDYWSGASITPARAWLEQNRMTRAIAALDRWRDQCAAIDASFGLPDLEAIYDGEIDALDAIAQRIEDCPPAGLADAALKLGVLLQQHTRGEATLAAPLQTLLKELEHLARLQRQESADQRTPSSPT